MSVTEKQLEREKKKAFAQGVVWAAGYLNTDLGDQSGAEYILSESGFDTRLKLRSMGIDPQDLAKVAKPLQFIKRKNQ